MTATLPDLQLQSHYEPLIGGKFQAFTAETFPAVNPSTGDVIATITRSGTEEIAAAVDAAKAAFPAWSATPPEARARLLHRLADWVEENTERLALIDALDIGRTIFETPMDHAFGARQYRFFAAAVVTHDGWHSSIPGGHAIAKREALGVVGQIIPWNVPGIMVGFKLAPALAAGNTVVLKPDENASLSTLELCRAAAEIFPPGVVNVVPGFGEEAGAALTALHWSGRGRDKGGSAAGGPVPDVCGALPQVRRCSPSPTATNAGLDARLAFLRRGHVTVAARRSSRPAELSRPSCPDRAVPTASSTVDLTGTRPTTQPDLGRSGASTRPT